MPSSCRARSRTSRPQSEAISPAQRITTAIIAKLEAGVSPWRKPWSAAAANVRPLRACGLPYKGINVVWLWSVAEDLGFASATWMTYRQANEYGGQVRKGERGTLAVFYKTVDGVAADGTHHDEEASGRRILRAYTVFNVDQIEGLPERFIVEPSPRPLGDDTHRDAIDHFIAASGARLVHGGDVACYVPGRDVIKLPHAADFTSYAAYGATAAHELAHWTGHPSRLDRCLQNRFGSDAYAAEELVAELASAFLGADLGLPVTHLDSHASYIDDWLAILRRDERALLTAAAKAEAAAAYLLDRARPAASDRLSSAMSPIPDLAHG